MCSVSLTPQAGTGERCIFLTSNDMVSFICSISNRLRVTLVNRRSFGIAWRYVRYWR